MRHLFVIIFAFCSLATNAQNQVVRRHGATSTTKRQGSSIQKKKSTSPATKKKALEVYNNSKSSSSSSMSNQTTSPTHQINASYSYGVLTVNGVRYEMVKVNAGTFVMGATSDQEGNARDNEKPAHQVTLTNNYYIGRTEVTQALWKAIMGSNPSYFRGDNKPVECVSWNDCQTFISRLNAATGRHFRLPTEAEWEFAARGGNNSQHYQYSGSNNLYEVAWYTGNSGDTTHDVATKQTNELGLYDMSGNVCEWCYDWYGENRSSPQTNPTGPMNGTSRVNRGGYWCSFAWNCCPSYRNDYNPALCYNDLGFRLALSE